MSQKYGCAFEQFSWDRAQNFHLDHKGTIAVLDYLDTHYTKGRSPSLAFTLRNSAVSEGAVGLPQATWYHLLWIQSNTHGSRTSAPERGRGQIPSWTPVFSASSGK